jgi:hypothetical protein
MVCAQVPDAINVLASSSFGDASLALATGVIGVSR